MRLQRYLWPALAVVSITASGAALAQAPSALLESETRVGSLFGARIHAGDDAPLALIVPGSGPTDRDGNNPAGINSNTYKMLATELARRGVSTVRVDKRGMFSSVGAGDPNAVTVELYAQDYREWAAALSPEARGNCIYLLGHSEGALMVSAAARVQDNICGLILVAGAGRPFGDILREQLRANPANALLLEDAFAAIDSLEAGETVSTDGMHPALAPLFRDDVQGFLISMMAVDPAAVAAAAGLPTLILQGDRDIQISVEDAQLLSDASGGELVILQGVNHILKEAPADRPGNLRTYGDPSLPIAPEAVDAIASFVDRMSARQ